MFNISRYFNCCISTSNVIDTNIDKFSFENIKGNYKVISVYDGDTVTLLLPINIHIYNFNQSDSIDIKSDTNPTNKIKYYKINVRLYGIDTPELKPSKNLIDHDNHKIKAIAAKNFLSNLLLLKIVNVHFMNYDKYGRPLAVLYLDDININELMINEGHAVKYYGGAKENFI